MGVGVDQAGHHHGAAGVDRLFRAIGRGDCLRRVDRHDVAAVDRDRSGGQHAAAAVHRDHDRVGDDQRHRSWRRLSEHHGPGQQQNRRACKHVELIVYSCAVPLHVVEHPLVHDALTTLRDVTTPPETFRRMAIRISLLLAAEATRDVPSEAVTVQTPLGPAGGRRVGAGVVVVPVLRAGLGMLDAVLELMPNARVGHIGLQRDELTAVASQYYSKLPPDLDGLRTC